MIKINNLTKYYKKTKVLDGLNLEINDGEIYGFIGQNGVGKSTTMNILTKIIKFNSGSCFVNHMDILKENIKKLNLGYLPEEPRFYNYMTPKEYLYFIGKICNKNKIDLNLKLNELLKLVKLEKFKNKPIGTFSRGMKQRMGIAVAIYNDPKTIILDEPSSALDPEGRKDVIDIIKELKEKGKTILVSTHILNDIEKICDKIGILKGGKIVIEDNLNNLMKKYIQPIYDIEFEYSIKSHYIKQIEDLDFVEMVRENNNKLSIKINNIEKNGFNLYKKIIDLEILPLSIIQRKNSLEEIFIEVAK
ncbi:MAG: ABC transporter ATP-binding protein [Clostridiales bacterium]